jgi:hypothetical protein
MRYIFANLEAVARSAGFIFDRNKIGSGEDRTLYDLTTNEKKHGAGATNSYATLEEAAADISEIQKGRSPLNGEPL